MEVDLLRLRRFGLIVAIVLITYVFAGIEMTSPAEVSPLGIPFEVRRPGLLPLGLVIASVYALSAFWYYGIMSAVSPMRRRYIWRKLRGPRNIDPNMILAIDDPELGNDVRKTTENAERAFPRVFGRRIDFVVESYEGRDQPVHAISEIIIPWQVRLASRLDELNYTAPIWMNGIALIAAGWMLRP